MSALTQNEREGLDDVFLSIQTGEKKYQKMKELSPLIISRHMSLNLSKHLKQAKLGLKETKLSQFLLNLSKKKKNLSK